MKVIKRMSLAKADQIIGNMNTHVFMDIGGRTGVHRARPYTDFDGNPTLPLVS